MVSIVVSIPACHAGDRGSIPRLRARSIPPVWEPFPVLITPNPIASLPECVPVFAPDVTNLPQKEQSACMDDEHIPSSEVILDSSVSPSPPEICSEPHISNYHHQQTVNVSQCSMELQDDHIVMSLHDIPIGDSETLLKQVLPCPISAQSLATVQIMCLKYNANDPPYIDTVNDSGMLIGQNLPGG